MSIHPAMRPVRRMVQCEGIVSLAMPCFAIILVLPFLNNPKDLDPSYKMDLDLGTVLEGKKSVL